MHKTNFIKIHKRRAVWYVTYKEKLPKKCCRDCPPNSMNVEFEIDSEAWQSSIHNLRIREKDVIPQTQFEIERNKHKVWVFRSKTKLGSEKNLKETERSFAV